MTSECTSKVHGHLPVKYMQWLILKVEENECHMLSPPVFYMATHCNTSESVVSPLSGCNGWDQCNTLEAHSVTIKAGSHPSSVDNGRPTQGLNSMESFHLVLYMTL